jgi:hypothetical protein
MLLMYIMLPFKYCSAGSNHPCPSLSKEGSLLMQL